MGTRDRIRETKAIGPISKIAGFLPNTDSNGQTALSTLDPLSRRSVLNQTQSILYGLFSAILLANFCPFLDAQEPLEELAGEKQVLTDERQAKTADFIRMVESADGQPLSLETAVITFQGGPSNTRVDLIGAVHIGEAAYYDELNRLFDQYDVLLYELVAEDGTVIQKNAKQPSDNPISFLQNATKDFLGMESQLEKIDYSKSHFIRADMTPEQIAEKMQSRGENMFTLALSSLLEAMRKQNLASADPKSAGIAETEMDILELLRSPAKAKIMMARQFAGSENLDLALGGSLNQLLVIDRNAEALKVLREQISKGHQKIGIFYGAAHLPDMQKHLIGDFGLARVGTQWLKAWDLTEVETASQPLDPISAMLNLLKEIQ